MQRLCFTSMVFVQSKGLQLREGEPGTILTFSTFFLTSLSGYNTYQMVTLQVILGLMYPRILGIFHQCISFGMGSLLELPRVSNDHGFVKEAISFEQV